MTTSLVTGGAGFIGSHLVRGLLERGHRVRVLDNFSTGKRENLGPVLGDIDLMEGDIRDLAACRSAAAGADFIFHQAALVSVPLSIENPFLTDDVNVGGTLNVLWAAKSAGTRKVVLASSTAVYGDNPDLPKREDMAGIPLSPYALSKWIGEKTCQSFSLIYGVRTVCLRYFNVFGPRQDPRSPYAAAVPTFISRMLDGRPPVIFGDGEQTRDFVFVLDVVRANILAAESDLGRGDVFNIASAERLSINALAGRINEVLGTRLVPVYEASRPGDILHSWADVTRARERLGFRPQVDFRQGLEKTISWHQDSRRLG